MQTFPNWRIFLTHTGRDRITFSDENGGLPRDEKGNIDTGKRETEQGFLNRLARLAHVGSLN